MISDQEIRGGEPYCLEEQTDAVFVCDAGGTLILAQEQDDFAHDEELSIITGNDAGLSRFLREGNIHETNGLADRFFRQRQADLQRVLNRIALDPKHEDVRQAILRQQEKDAPNDKSLLLLLDISRNPENPGLVAQLANILASTRSNELLKQLLRKGNTQNGDVGKRRRFRFPVQKKQWIAMLARAAEAEDDILEIYALLLKKDGTPRYPQDPKATTMLIRAYDKEGRDADIKALVDRSPIKANLTQNKEIVERYLTVFKNLGGFNGENAERLIVEFVGGSEKTLAAVAKILLEHYSYKLLAALIEHSASTCQRTDVLLTYARALNGVARHQDALNVLLDDDGNLKAQFAKNDDAERIVEYAYIGLGDRERAREFLAAREEARPPSRRFRNVGRRMQG